MEWQTVLAAGLTLVGIITALAVAYYAWEHRSIPGAEHYALYMLAAMAWSSSLFVELIDQGTASQLLAGFLQTVGLVTMPAAWLAFALKYCGHQSWMSRRDWILLGLVPVASLVLWFLHNLVEMGVQPAPAEGSFAWRWMTALDWLINVYASVLILAGAFIMLQELVRAPRIYRRQYLILLIGGLTPWAFGLASMWGFNPFGERGIMVAFVVGGIVGAWGLFRFQVFEIMPVAVDRVVENMDDGVIVLDIQDRIVALNPAAQAMTGLTARKVEGQLLAKVLPHWIGLVYHLDYVQTRTEVTTGQGERQRHYELRISPLFNRWQLFSGRLLLMHDITNLKRTEAELLRINAEHARRNRELELLNRVIAATTSEQEPEAVLEAVCRELRLALDVPRVAAALANDSRTELRVVAESRVEEAATSLGAVIPVSNNPATLQVLEQKAPLAVADAQHDPRMAPVHGLMAQQGVASLLILPLVVRGTARGTIGLDTTVPRSFSDEELALGGSVAAAAAQALENAWAGAALRREKMLMDALLDNVPDSIYFKDRQGRHTRVNRLMLEGQRCDECQCMGKTDVELYGPAYGDSTLADDLQVIASGRPLLGRLEKREMPNGKTIWTLTNKVPLRDESGEIVGLAGVTRDVTAMKQAEEALRQNEERLKLAIEGAGLGLWDLDLATGTTFIDKLGMGYLGFQPGELATADEVDCRLREALHPDDRTKLDEAIARHLSGATPLMDVELRCRMGPDDQGDWSWLLMRGKVVTRDESGAALRISGITQDITERKRAAEALAESEERLKVAMEAADLAIWDLNLATGTVVVAHGEEAGWGYDDEANMWNWSHWVHRDDWPRVQSAINAHLAGETPAYEVEFRSRSFKGAPDTMAWYAHRGRITARDAQGRPVRVTGIQEDITARKQAEAELRQAKEAAETANRAKSAFLANMSHELRTPLNAILGFSQLMDRDPGLAPEHRESLQTVRQSGEHLLTLINDVLEVSKIEAGRTTLQERDFDLHRLLTDVESMFRLRATDKGLQLLFERAPELPQYLHCDESKMRQVLINLLSNAVKFTAEGGITVRAAFRDEVGAESGGRLYFEVEDTGIGIAASEVQSLFDPFVQATSSQAYVHQEGTGLGLTISRHFVQLMGGTISLVSELGRGSTFKFDVRASRAEGTDVRPEAPPRKVVGLEPDQPVYRLLVAEDREANRRLLVKLLTSLGSPPFGFEVREAVNGLEALQVWEQWEPHLIWMDMRMPVMDGHEATRRIKATVRGQATVIVALTASAFEEDRVMILSNGCDDFVRKPFRESEIFSVLERHLGVRFIYEDRKHAALAQPSDSQKVVTLRALAALPAEWVTALHQASLQADEELVLDLVAQIRDDHRLLAEALEAMVRGFRFDIIMTLSEQAGG